MESMLQEFMALPFWLRASIALGSAFVLWIALGGFALRLLSIVPYCLRQVIRALYRALSFAVGYACKTVGGPFLSRLDSGWTNLVRVIDSRIGIVYNRMRKPKTHFIGAAFLISVLLVAWIVLPQQLGVGGDGMSMAYNTFNGFENWVFGSLAGSGGANGQPLRSPPGEEPLPRLADGSESGSGGGSGDTSSPSTASLSAEDGGAVIRFFDDALPAGAALAVEVSPGQVPLPPAPIKLVSAIYDVLGLGADMQSQFASNGVLELKYDAGAHAGADAGDAAADGAGADAGAAAADGDPADSLAIFYYNPERGEWVFLGGDVDAASSTVAAPFGRFAKVAVFSDPTTKEFRDVGRGHWAHAYVRRLAALGIVEGYPLDGGLFEYLPDVGVTFAEAIYMTVTSMGIPLAEGFDGGALFAGWDEDYDWVRPYIGAAIEVGIISERGDVTSDAGTNAAEGAQAAQGADAVEAAITKEGVAATEAAQAAAEGADAAEASDLRSIDPERYITRQELAVMAVRALGVGAPTGPDGLSSLADLVGLVQDIGDVEGWAIDAFIIALDAGIVELDGALARPANTATRAEAAMAICKMLESKGL